MNVLNTNKNFIILAFLLSLLFHASTIFYLFTQQLHKSLMTEMEKNQNQQAKKEIEKKQKQAAWVETKARADNFGAPVFFEDEPETSKQVEREQDTTLKQNKNDTTEDCSITEEIESPEKKDSFETPQPSLDTSNKPHESSEKNNVIISTPAPDPSKKNPKKTITQKKSQETQREYAPIQSRTPQIPKPPITFAELAQGFLHQKREQSGAYGISMLGMKSGLPTDEQMKYERYLQKLCWCIQNSLKINEHKQPRLLQPTNIHIFFVLDRDGTLKQLAIKKSSGNMHLDQFILFIFRDASSSFPPVPSYLPDDPFSMTCILS